MSERMDKIGQVAHGSSTNPHHDGALATGTESRPTKPGQGVQQAQSQQPAQHWLLLTLEHLLAIEALDVKSALDEASDLVAKTVGADKVDIFLYEPATNSLVAMGVSHKPLSRRQLELGLNRMPFANGGRSVQVYINAQSHITGHADQDPEELLGVKDPVGGLGIKSVIAVPLYVAGELRGVVQVDSQQPDAFTEYDLHFMEAVAGWIGIITHRAELIEQIRRDAAEEAKRTAAEEMVTIIGHDLNNYLTPLTGRVQLLRRKASREGQESYRRDADEISSVVKRIEKLVQNLMDLGRLEQGIFQLARHSTDLVALAEDIARALGTPACPVEARSYGRVQADVDKDKIRQALENLVTNAVRHSPEGAPVYVTVATEKREDGEWALIAVKDQGPGISPELMPKLFTRFAPGPSSAGLGLGLYLAQGIAHAHGGAVTVESPPGAGATFCLSVPMGISAPLEAPG
ncbi:MAG: GAF domain-containing sensor histidine kinase [Chloroflexi bacterium]|nr:GAF domain-containing sensor histidine kinase [Chloroflexota bacterium]